MVSTTSLVCLLVLAAAAAVSAADSDAKRTQMFVDWIAQQTSPKIKTAGYAGLETESVCLMESKLRNCRCLNEAEDPFTGCQRAYEETTMACCEHDPSAFMSESTLLGVCSWTSDFFPTSVKYDGTTTEKIGIFTVKCEMREDAEKCGSPLCEGMSLDGSGDILIYPKVAFVGESATEAITKDTDCEAFTLLDPTTPPGPRTTGPGKSTKVRPAKLQYESEEEEQPNFYLGKGEIYSGTFRVTSRFHASKFKTGQIQLAFPTQPLNATHLVSSVPERAYIARAHQVNLEFIKGTEGY